jgi:hypothetical protein
MPDDKPLPWNQADDADWTKQVGGWPWRSLGGGDWAKSGSCPRCQHDVHVSKVASVYLRLDFERTPDLKLLLDADHGPIMAKADEGETFYARCNCGEAHPGRPAELKYGCGRSGYIDPPARR